MSFTGKAAENRIRNNLRSSFVEEPARSVFEAVFSGVTPQEIIIRAEKLYQDAFSLARKGAPDEKHITYWPADVLEPPIRAFLDTLDQLENIADKNDLATFCRAVKELYPPDDDNRREEGRVFSEASTELRKEKEQGNTRSR
ncbi:MAG TPA: hypothetical protein VFT64_07090 [Rickettsiales bacterium]|nr:hypothetical protein [Rickettsiales bacterium]